MRWDWRQLTASSTRQRHWPVFAIGLYATGAIPAYVTAVWFFLLAVVGGVAPPEVVFSGFASMGFWMVFGGLLIGIAVHETGLARRAANAMAHGFGRSYFGNVAGIVGVGLAFAFIIPSTMGRVVVLMPIVLKLAENHGFEAGSNGRNGFVIALVFGTLLPAFALLPSNLPNIILTGAADSLFAITLNYGEYLVLHFPILGLLKAVLMIVLIVVLFGETPLGQAQTVASTPLSSDERRLTVILAATLVLWMTDTVHGIAPGWISLAAGSACLLPRLGVLRPSLVESMNYGALLYVAGIIGLGATIAASGLGDRLGSLLLDVIGFALGEDARNLGAMTAVSMAVGLTATQASIPAILTPLSDGVAAAMGLSAGDRVDDAGARLLVGRFSLPGAAVNGRPQPRRRQRCHRDALQPLPAASDVAGAASSGLLVVAYAGLSRLRGKCVAARPAENVRWRY